MLRRLCSRLLIAHQQGAGLLSRQQQLTLVTPFCSHTDKNDGYGSDDNGRQSGSGKQSQQQGSQGGSKKSVNDLYNEEGAEFLRTMDEITLLKKKRIEAEIEDLSLREAVPKNLTPAHWKTLLTECPSISKRNKFLKYLLKIEYTNENQRLKKQVRRMPQIVDEHRVLEELTYLSRTRFKKENKFGCYKSLVFGNPLVFDMDYPGSTREERHASQQFMHCYGNNLRHEFPFHLHVTGYENKHIGKAIEVENYDEHLFATFHKGCFTDLFDRDRLMYLSPDGPPLTRHDPETVYVIGGLVDVDGRSNISKAKAKELGIRCGRIPLDRHVRMLSKHVLTLDAVLNIMLTLNATHDWRQAIIGGLPKTAFTILGEEDQRRMLRKKAPHLLQTRDERNWRKKQWEE